MRAENNDGISAPVGDEGESGEHLGDKHYHESAKASASENDERVVDSVCIVLKIHAPSENPCGYASDDDKQR